MAEKVTVMVLKVDLQCPCCYKKVKKILCKFPQIRDQAYNEKANTVTIKVVCCNPEKLRDKLCCKGAPVIKSIEIVDPPKKQPDKPPKVTPPPPAKPVEEPPKVAPPPPAKPVEEPPKVTPPPPAKPVEEPKKVPKPHPAPDPVPAFPVRTCCGSCYEGRGGGPCYQGYPSARTCCGSCYEGRGGGPCYQGYPSARTCCGSCYEGRGGGPCYQGYPSARTCCGSCYEGQGGGPCYQGNHGYGVPSPPQLSLHGNVGYGRGGYGVSRCDSYLSEENPHSCAIM